ncbi:MAG: guanylate kinase [Candidatus Saccharimonadales bacterium]
MDTQELIANYQPSRAAITLIQSTKIVLLVGISGAGKDTIKRRLLERDDYKDIISHTTRAPRMDDGVLETDGIEYNFVSMDEARDMLEQQAFIEAKFVHGSVVYGTSVKEVEDAYKQGKIAITDIDVQGVEEYKQLSQDVVAVFILPPDFTTWRERLSKRYATPEEFEAEWPKRRASAITELRQALEVPYYHFIINDNLDETVRIADEIAHKPDLFTRKDDLARLAARDLLASIEAKV